MSKWGANIVNCIWINRNHWAKYLKASIAKEWNGWTHALFEIFAFATNGDGGDSGSVSSNDNGGIDDPNVCEKLHELVLTSTEKSGIHAYPYTQRRRRRRKERFSFYDCRTQMQQSVLMCVLSKANVDITQEWQAHKTYTHTHICSMHRERKKANTQRERYRCSYAAERDDFMRKLVPIQHRIFWATSLCVAECFAMFMNHDADAGTDAGTRYSNGCCSHMEPIWQNSTQHPKYKHMHTDVYGKKASGCAHLNVCVPMTDFP